MTNTIWQVGALIDSEKLPQLFTSKEAHKWGFLVCVVLGNRLTPSLQAVTANPKINTYVSGVINQLNTNYEHVRDGLLLPQKSISIYDRRNVAELQRVEMLQAVQAQELPWIKAALLTISDINKKIKEQITTNFNDCVNCLHTLLDTTDEVTVRVRQLASLKSFLASQICLYRRENDKTQFHTWDEALLLWTTKCTISQTAIATRITAIAEELKKISCLEDHSENTQTVTFEYCGDSVMDTTYTSFRSFLATESVTYICDLFKIQKASCPYLLRLFASNEYVRSLSLFYCSSLTRIQEKCTASEQFCQDAEQECLPIKTLLLENFFSIIADASQTEGLSKILRDKLNRPTSTIESFRLATASGFGKNDEGVALELKVLIEHFYFLEVFFESITLLLTMNITSQQLAQLPPEWHPFSVLMASDSTTRSAFRNTVSIAEQVALAFYPLKSLEDSYEFTIPQEEKLLAAIRCQGQKTPLLPLYKAYTGFSSAFSIKSPLDRLRFLLDCTLGSEPCLLSEYYQQNSQVCSTETEYLKAAKNSRVAKCFPLALTTIIQELNIAPTFDEIILVCTHAPQQDYNFEGYGFYIAEVKKLLKRLEKYQFSNFQKLLIAIELIHTKIKAMEPVEDDVDPGNLPSRVEEHIDMLFNLEGYLRLDLPKEIAFSWLIYREMNRTKIADFLKDLETLRSQTSLNADDMEKLATTIFTCLSPQDGLRVLPEADPTYKTALMLFCSRTIYNTAVNETQGYTASFFFPKTLPYPDYGLENIFSATDPNETYTHHHQLFFSSWNESKDGFYDYSLFMVKNFFCLETYSSSFRLEISKKRFQELGTAASFVHAFLGYLLSFLVSDLSMMAPYFGDTPTPNEIKSLCETALNFMKNDPKTTKSPILQAAFKEFPSDCYEEIKAVFIFAYKLHHFVRKNFVKFSTKLSNADIAIPRHHAATGIIYDGMIDDKPCLSLLPIQVAQKSQFKSCYIIAKDAPKLSIETAETSSKTFFFEHEKSVEKKLFYTLVLEKETVDVTISMKNPAISLSMSYPKTSFLSTQDIQQLIAWQTLLLKSKFYKQAISVKSATTHTRGLSLTTNPAKKVTEHTRVSSFEEKT
jgi:hypothetical protein